MMLINESDGVIHEEISIPAPSLCSFSLFLFFGCCGFFFFSLLLLSTLLTRPLSPLLLGFSISQIWLLYLCLYFLPPSLFVKSIDSPSLTSASCHHADSPGSIQDHLFCVSWNFLGLPSCNFLLFFVQTGWFEPTGHGYWHHTIMQSEN